MKKRIKLIAPAIKTRDQVESLLNEICTTTINRNQATLAMDHEITQIRERYEATITACNKALEEKTELIRTWAEANPSEFNGLKSLDLVNAVIGWRTGQPTLKTLAGWTWDRVLEKLKIHGMGLRYIRTKEEVNKQAILSEREEITPEAMRAMGVRIVQDESFFVDPKLT
ncbi:MAG: hypothetical protein ABS95_02545, partial [Verrucomicrobia bacterium SCN 57-15]